MSERNIRTSVRLSLQFAFLYSILAGVIFVGAYWFTNYEVHDWITDQLRSDVSAFTEIYETEGATSLINKISVLSDINFESARIYQLKDAAGKVVAGNVLSPLGDNTSGFIAVADLTLSTELDDEVTSYWVRADAIGPYMLFQGAGNHVIGEVLEALGIALIGGYVLIIGFGLLFGTRVGRITEERISLISETLEKVSDGQLDARIPEMQSRGDDLSRVAANINTTLAQLKRLLESQEQITTDIAHDLRTPLQRLYQRLEGMQTSQHIAPEDIEASMLQTQEIIETFNALLRIAQIEAGVRQERFAAVNLREIIANVVDAFEPSAEDKGQSLKIMQQNATATIEGDQSLLTQLFSNLVENAITHCPSKTKITVSIQDTHDGVTVKVTDNGPGIDEKDKDSIFTRFYRAEKSRHTEGNGLGLPLVKAISELHKADLVVDSDKTGTNITVGFSLLK